VVDFFAVEDPWQRPGRLERRDVLVGLGTWSLSTFSLELSRSLGGLDTVGQPAWLQWLAVALGAGLLVGRRRWPLTVAALAALHMFVLGLTMPVVMAQLALQIVYFVAIFSGVAWARSRRDMLIVIGAVVALMIVWLAWSFALGSALDEIRSNLDKEPPAAVGLVGGVTAAVLLTALVNLLYFGGAIIGGQISWRAARQRARLAEQAATIAAQSQTLQRRAVLDERLRIARELHDVVAHHVSVIGVQAGAARRVLDRDPVAATGALAQIEASAREAVQQMRSLVGTLRDPDDTDAAADGERSRAPEPGCADLAELVRRSQDSGLSIAYSLVADPPGAELQLPSPVGLSIYRTAQEALTNIRRHSTAGKATVVLRVQAQGPGAHAEIEVTDDGRPRPGSSGSGLGLLGVRERAASQRADVDIGPRVGGGYRVRVRFPLSAADGGRPDPLASASATAASS
jgi:signal transduction histidine kinase